MRQRDEQRIPAQRAVTGAVSQVQPQSESNRRSAQWQQHQPIEQAAECTAAARGVGQQHTQPQRQGGSRQCVQQRVSQGNNGRDVENGSAAVDEQLPEVLQGWMPTAVIRGEKSLPDQRDQRQYQKENKDESHNQDE